MTDKQKDLVRGTFARAERMSQVVGLAFYQRLFELDPSLRPMFRNDIEAQSLKLMSTLKLAVEGLDQPKELVGAVQALGRRHVEYGVKEEHYETVGTALLWSLEKALGPSFTPAAREAWQEVYTWLADTMKTAARANRPRLERCV